MTTTKEIVPLDGRIRGDVSERAAMKHGELRWNPATLEWYCVRCGRTSDHLAIQAAKIELSQLIALRQNQMTIPSPNRWSIKFKVTHYR